MKKTLILCVLSALVAAGVTHWIDKNQYIQDHAELIEHGKLERDRFTKKIKDWKPESLPIDSPNADRMIEKFATQIKSSFFIPMAWTFKVQHIQEILKKMPNVERIKFYAGIKIEEDELPVMTLIMLGNLNGKDVTVVDGKELLFEYADPCPPKCGECNAYLMSSRGCGLKWVKEREDVGGWFPKVCASY